MSTTSSPRSDWFSSARIRRPSKASPAISSSSEVHVDAQPAYGASPEGRAQSRQTLSRHLSQSKLGVESDVDRLSPGDLGRPRSESVTSTASATSSVNPAGGTRLRSTSPSNSPTASPAAPRRSPSATAGSAPLPRSPSWYQTTSRKSSLALPALSTIEGSIADLRVENSGPEDLSDPELLSFQQDSSTSSTSMKRDRTSHSLGNPKQPKRQATEDDREAGLIPGTGSGGKGNNLPDDPTNQESLYNRDTSPTDHADAPSQGDSKASNATLRNWRSYLTLSKSSKSLRDKPRAVSSARESPSITDPEALAIENAHPSEQGQADEGGSQVQATGTPGYLTLNYPEGPSSSVADSGNSLQVRTHNTKLDIIAFAASDGVEPIVITAEEDQRFTHGNSSEDPNISHTTLRPETEGHARPSSWWGWPLATSPSTDIQRGKQLPHTANANETFDKNNVEASRQPAVHYDADPSAVLQPSRDGTKAENSTNAAKSVGTDTTTWSAWIGSYLSAPVESTTVTYAAGIAPSITSSAASSTVPDADETSPPPPQNVPEAVEHVHVTPSPTLQRVNPLLEVMPRSTWSSFFASRILPYQKAIDIKPAQNEAGEPEAMEIDFGSLAPAETVGESVKIASSASQTSSKTAIQEKGVNTTGASEAPLQGLNSPSPLDATISKTSTIKPLTKDRKAKTSTSSKSKPSMAKSSKPNLVLPSFEDTFERPPRSLPLPRPPSTSPAGLKKAVTASLSYLFSSSASRSTAPVNKDQNASLKGKEREAIGSHHERLPKSHKIAGTTCDLHQNGKIAVIGVHGWFIQTYLKNVVGEPTGTSTKFANMMRASVKAYYAEMGCALNDEAITAIPLEGDGTVKDRTERLYENLMARQDWIEALNNADRIFIASHSQGTIVSTMLVERLINEGEINGTRCMMLNMCSVSQGPFYSLYNSWTVPAYLYFETAAATELFEFQKPQSAVSKAYVASLQHILNAGVKVLFVASLNDQVVPLYSALFSSLSHPNILRTIFIDSSVFETSADFMTNLVVFSTRLRNAGLNCHGLDFHLSEALMGSLVGVGHSTVYEEAMVYKYAIRYLMETTSPLLHDPNAVNQSDDEAFKIEDFNPRAPANPYFLPWALRGIIEDAQIRTLFSEELQTLRDQFEVWQPKTKALQQVQAALEPLRLIPRSVKSESEFENAVSKTDKKATAKL